MSSVLKGFFSQPTAAICQESSLKPSISHPSTPQYQSQRMREQHSWDAVTDFAVQIIPANTSERMQLPEHPENKIVRKKTMQLKAKHERWQKVCHTTNVFHTEEIVLPDDADHGGQQSDKYLNRLLRCLFPFLPLLGTMHFLHLRHLLQIWLFSDAPFLLFYVSIMG